MDKVPSFDKLLQVQDSLKSVPGYEEVFQLMTRASPEKCEFEVGLCEQVKEIRGLDLIGKLFLS